MSDKFGVLRSISTLFILFFSFTGVSNVSDTESPVVLRHNVDTAGDLEPRFRVVLYIDCKKNNSIQIQIQIQIQI